MSGKKKEKNVSRKNEIITVRKLNHPSCVSEFVRAVNSAIKRGYKSLEVNFIYGDKTPVFPDACLPISVFINNIHELCGIDINLCNLPPYLERCSFLNPSIFDKNGSNRRDDLFDKVIMYSDEGSQVGDIVQSIVNYVSKDVACEQGVLDALIWCINEVMDNVLVHSGKNYGYIMAQFHRKKKNLAICVCDCGIGIYNSLQASEKHRPKSKLDAITLAVQEGVGDGEGQGNGLFGLYQMINDNNGWLTITSDGAYMMLDKSEMKKSENLPILCKEYPGTIVDFEINLDKKIDIKKVLRSWPKFEITDLRIDDMWGVDNCYHYNVFENATGTGTRNAGRLLRNDVLNIIKRIESPIVLDFSDVKACSSSFIDEFVAKLYLELGMLEFNKRVVLVKMNDMVSHLCERSVAMRVSEEWKNIVDVSVDKG